MMVDLSSLDELRKENGLLTVKEVIGLNEGGNVIYDPFSTLISIRAKIGAGNTIYPCVSLLCASEAELQIGDNNQFYGGTIIEAIVGSIVIGSRNIFGEGGFSAKTNAQGANISIEDGGRYKSGAAIYGKSRLGSGSQVLGPISVDSCILDGGASFQESDALLRAGLLKGHGSAKGLTVPKGFVIQGAGSFDERDMKPQSYFHPKGPK